MQRRSQLCANVKMEPMNYQRYRGVTFDVLACSGGVGSEFRFWATPRLLLRNNFVPRKVVTQ